MATSGPVTQTVDVESRKWKARPGLAMFLRISITALPFVASLAFSLWARRAFPPEKIGVGRFSWVVGVWLLSMLLLVGADRVLRRVMPLAALFKLSLVFPDKAPQRFSVALRTGTTRQLQRRINDVNETGISPLEQKGASELLELVAALGVHDRLTRGHCERVRAYTDLIAEEMGLSEEDRSKLHWAAMLHDVGKLAVPFEILNSPDRPTEGEWRILQSHTTAGAAMAEPLRPWLGEWVDAIRSHHERWDGGGYPDGLAATDIPLGARIVAVADAFDVMTSKRSYKEPIPQTEARAEIAECSGGQFDPEVARAFLGVGIGRLRLVMGPLSWLTSLPGAGGTATTTAVSNVAIGVAAVAAGLGVAVPVVSSPPSELASIAPDTTAVETTRVPVTSSSTTPTSGSDRLVTLPPIGSSTAASTEPTAPTSVQPTVVSGVPTTAAPTTLAPTTVTPTAVTSTAATPTAPAPTTAAPTSLAPTAPPTTAAATTTTAPPIPEISVNSSSEQWIVNGANQRFIFTSTVEGTWQITGLPAWVSRIDSPTRLELVDNSAAANRGASANLNVRLVSGESVPSNDLAVGVAVRPEGLSDRAFDIQITEFTDWEVDDGTPEFVEIKNRSDAIIGLDGLILSDDPPLGPLDEWPFSISLNGIVLQPGQSTVLWINDRRAPGVTGGHLFDPPTLDINGNFLQSGGDELWLYDIDGLVVDYLGWFNPVNDAWDQFVGSPAPYLGFCPGLPCYRLVENDTVTPGWSWKRDPANPFVLTEGPSDPTID